MVIVPTENTYDLADMLKRIESLEHADVAIFVILLTLVFFILVFKIWDILEDCGGRKK